MAECKPPLWAAATLCPASVSVPFCISGAMTDQFQNREARGGDSSFSFPFLPNPPPVQPCTRALLMKESSATSSPWRWAKPPLQAPNPHCVKKLNFGPEIRTPDQVEAKIWTLLPLFSLSCRLVQVSSWAEHYLVGAPVKEPVSLYRVSWASQAHIVLLHAP